MFWLIIWRRRMFATNRFVTSACSGQSVTSRLRSITSWHMFVTVNVSFDVYACHEVHFVAKFIWSRTYIPKSSRREVTSHRNTYNVIVRSPQVSKHHKFLSKWSSDYSKYWSYRPWSLSRFMELRWLESTELCSWRSKKSWKKLAQSYLLFASAY